MNQTDQAPTKRGILELKTAEGDGAKGIYMHSTIFRANFAANAEKKVDLDRRSTLLLFRILYGELIDEDVRSWV